MEFRTEFADYKDELPFCGPILRNRGIFIMF